MGEHSAPDITRTTELNRDTPTADRWRQISHIFDSVLDLPAELRVEALRKMCGDDSALRAEVEALLGASDMAGKFMEEPARDYVAPLLQSSTEAQPPMPTRVGPFRIVREIGRGGMGTVYLAERDDEQFHHQVALKVARAAFADPHTVRRFLDERQILAWLTHPNIAALVDGGVTDDGAPWFAMEYVEGISIDRYCDEHRLGVDERLALFGQVCNAVDHAHRKLIVHRDLKPGNILVTASGQVKLLDFGIAKLLDPTPAVQPSATATTRYLTPEYASPEQLRGDPVSTTTDVYALGVLLCRLLTSAYPHRASDDSLAAWARRFSERPPAPSALLDAGGSFGGMTVSPTHVASARGTTTNQLRRRLRGDLDAITLKALEPEPENRYRSVEQLASDVRRHSLGLTVSARGSSAGYAVRTFVKRHRLGVSTLVGLFVVVLSFGIVTAIQSRRIRAQAARIATERDKAREVASFLVALFTEADPYKPGSVAPSVIEILNRGAEQVEHDLESQPEVRAEMMFVMGQAYFGLGDLDRSARMLEGSAALFRRTGSESRELATTLNYLAQVRRNQRRAPAAESLYREVLRQRRRLLPPDDPQIILTLSGLGSSLQAQGRHDEAERTLRDALAIERKRQPLDLMAVAQLSRNLGHSLRDQERFAEAEVLYREALSLHERQFGSEHPESANSMVNLGNVLRRLNRLPEAERLLRAGVAIKSRLLGERHWDVLGDQVTLAQALTEKRSFVEADSLLAHVLAVHRETLPRGDRQIGDDLYDYGFLRAAMGDARGARAMLEEALAIYRGAPLPIDIRRQKIEQTLAGLLAAKSR
jgi:serine/threonine-protein kinase